jgi:hypothetical protein
VTPDPILLDTTDADADAADVAEADDPSRLWWLVVLVLSTLFWVGLIVAGIVIVSMV